ncbi:MAG: MarR family transcriptional regulator [Actinomycetota bacterium]|nr:MarR family transcriptional regulator [Actinomycetota bacterium]
MQTSIEVSHNPAMSAIEVPRAPIGSALLRLIRAHAQFGTTLLAEIGLAPPQELILLRLDEHGTLPQSEIVRFLNRDRSTVSTTLRTMERTGLITRGASARDRRALDVSLTDAGRALCPAVRAAWADLEEAAFAHLPADVRAMLVRAMGSARDALVASTRERAQ